MILALLKALGVTGLGQLKTAGPVALKAALQSALARGRAGILKKALTRLTKDGDVAKLTQDGPFMDRDGVAMTGRQMFAHQALYAIPRAAGIGGTLTDLVRDDHVTAWGLAEADTLLSGVTDGSVALSLVFDRLLEQIG
jgi:hypothetical protein